MGIYVSVSAVNSAHSLHFGTFSQSFFPSSLELSWFVASESFPVKGMAYCITCQLRSVDCEQRVLFTSYPTEFHNENVAKSNPQRQLIKLTQERVEKKEETDHSLFTFKEALPQQLTFLW